MPSFQYKGRNKTGALVNGRLQAVSADAAASDLFGNNITPIDITEEKSSKSSKGQSNPGDIDFSKFADLFVSKKISLTELVIFSRQMHSLTKAGMPLDKSLRGLEASVSSVPLQKVLHDIASQLEKGMDLAGSMGRHPEIFNSLYLSLIHVGENTGRLDLSFLQIVRYLELERETTKQMKSATRYPTFVLITIGIALGIITVFVIPVFAETFKKLNAELPWQTVVLINVSDFVVTFWPLIIGIIFACIYSFKRYVKTEQGLLNWDRKKLSIPIVGGIFEKVALSRFSRTFAMMTSAGVPIIQGLSVIAQAVGNKYISGNVIKMREAISHGESLYQSAVKSRMFSPLILQMIAVGEETGSVDELLEEVADFYDSEVEYDLKRMSASLEPILIVFVAGMVLVLALGVFLPIWDLANAAQ